MEAVDQIDPDAINRFAGTNIAKDKPWSAETEALSIHPEPDHRHALGIGTRRCIDS